jgi:hypothetical protein
MGGAGLGGGTGVGVGAGGGIAAAACSTTKGNPAIVNVPLRSPAVLASATNAALPVPVSSELTTRTQGASLDALHLHPEIVATETVKGPPSGDTCEEELSSEKRQGAASCETAT